MVSGKLSIEKFGRRKLHFSILINNYLVSYELHVKNTVAF